MIIEFGILGLVIMFMLMIMYYSKDVVNKFCSKLLMLGYLSNFIYILTFIFSKTNNSLLYIFIHLYLFTFIIELSLLNVHIIDYIIKNKEDYDNKIKFINCINIILNIIVFLFISILPYKIDNNIIGGLLINATLKILFVYSVIGVILLFISNINMDKFKKIFIIYLIIISSIIIQYNFIDINVLNLCFVVCILYVYLSYNNSSNNMEDIKLEKENILRVSNNINKFLSNMSYEIRTPLNTIDGLCHVISNSNDIDSIKEDIKDIKEASDDLIEIINGIIDISTIESGEMNLSNDNYNPVSLFDNINKIVNSRLKDKNVKFKMDISKNIPNTLNGDSNKIEHILINILMNSIKYTTKGYIILKVDCINSSAMSRLKITVSDTGKGIKEDELKNIFNKNNNGKIGLVISKKLVDLMNGKIDIESTYNKGTTTVVTIDQKVVNILNEPKIEEKKKLELFNLSNKRILVVDDNKLNLKVASKLLSSYKAEITTVNSGEECLEIISSDSNYDLILMDDMMPNMTGSETLDTLLKIERVEGFHIPVVVLTANAISGMKEKYLKLGFDDFLAKPIDKYELNRVLKKFLKK